MRHALKISVSRRKICRLCDGAKLELVVPLLPTPVAEKYVTREHLHEQQETYPLDLYMCLECGHIQLLDVVDPEFLFRDFTYASANTKALVQNFEETAETTCSRYGVAPKGLVVDIGSNDGSLLRCFQRRGRRVLGVDPAAEIARRAIDSGIPTIVDFLTPEVAQTIRSEHGLAAVVCAFNVFAHADDLAGMTDSIRELMAPDGVFVFEISYLLDVVDRMLLGTIFHEHLSYHSLKPFVAFLRRHGMELIDVQRVMIQGGSVVGTAQLIGGPHPVSPSVRELLEVEEARGLDRPATLKKFATQLQDVKRQLGDMITDLRRQGKTIWGYGAARSGTTLISQMKLGNVISVIVDDSPDKQDKYSPGDHIPILPSKALYERKPDYAFILAWIHAPKIVENNQAFLKQGGKFILCFPEIQIIGAEQGLKK
jgi:SAM-dependent methyltransferase